ncbi:MAG: serine/threonine protein kinase [Eggerthellaceae bacterium]|nr:serine/threonine protein kinase [Eggerthellaceae bacterium]
MTGKTLGNRYELGERIGMGGMASVFAARDNVLDRDVAVKVMLPQFAADPGFARRFHQEATAAASLQSAHIVTIYDWGQDGDDCYLVMELLPGSDLRSFTAAGTPLDPRRVAEIGAQICRALSVAHDQGIIHRDIAPQNIMVLPDESVKVMDFGIAKVAGSELTQTSTVLGTARYLSPEQAQGKPLTPASDLYSLGVVLYELAAGQPPFTGPDPISVALQHVSADPVPPSTLNPNISNDLSAVIMRALSKRPEERFSSAREMGDALTSRLDVTNLTASPCDSDSESATQEMKAPQSNDRDKTRAMPRLFDGTPDATLLMHSVSSETDALPDAAIRVKAPDSASRVTKGRARTTAAAIMGAAIVIACCIVLTIRPWEPWPLPETGGDAESPASAELPEDARTGDDKSSSGTQEEKGDSGTALSQRDIEITLQLQELCNQAGSYDKQIGEAASLFNSTYLSASDIRQRNASSASTLASTLEQQVKDLKQWNLLGSSACYQPWQQVCELYDCLYQRISVIDQAWSLSLRYSNPADHQSEILEPLTRDKDESGNNRYYARFQELLPQIKLPSLDSSSVKGSHVENDYVAFDLPPSWEGKVNVFYVGDDIIVRSKKDGTAARTLLTATVVSEFSEGVGGDIANSRLYFHDNSKGQRIEFWQTRYAFIARENASRLAAGETVTFYPMLDDADLNEIISIQTGLSLREVLNASDDSIVFRGDDFFDENIVPTIQVK